ncbi:tellurite resistance TerB family protein [Pseudorhodoferax sp.]|jgi:uncharacterized tellurite resistance protein B-like protein|uniref:tellurite resistance TerB family protein n=1 Tax=Pseudorhodoferax sp. TaxID=1993553 RepID=UPI001B610D96|nr:TerB family tellurite resistance protein [Pseudorhodoferax sp.]MBP8146250.1 TerB family tellurite resistance protein [Inhella sp.]
MLRTLKDLFAPLFDPTQGAPADRHTLELASAVLLVEVMRAEAGIGAAERAAALQALERKFALSADERETLLAHAEGVARDATDLHQFTSVLNERLDDAAKVRMVEAMWQVALADGEIAAHERHIVWRVADLLHLHPGDFAATRSRALAARDDTPAG